MHRPSDASQLIVPIMTLNDLSSSVRMVDGYYIELPNMILWNFSITNFPKCLDINQLNILRSSMKQSHNPALIWRALLLFFFPASTICKKCEHIWYPRRAADSWASIGLFFNFVSQWPDSAATTLLRRWPMFWLVDHDKKSKDLDCVKDVLKLSWHWGRISYSFLSCESWFKFHSRAQWFPKMEL